MLTKTGNITLNDTEKTEVQNGQIPERISQLWPGITLTELYTVINNQEND